MKRFSVALLGLLLAACSDVDQVLPPPEAGLLTNDLTFLRFRGDAYDAAEKSGSFWAVKGEARSLVLRYTDTGREFLRFHVGPNTLVDRDSVLIGVEVDAAGDLAFHFSPSGLRFNGAAPAVLLIDRGRAHPDINRNGYVDLFDTLLSLQAGIYKRELPILPWLKIPSLNLLSSVAQADVYDFTSFGMAVD